MTSTASSSADVQLSSSVASPALSHRLTRPLTNPHSGRSRPARRMHDRSQSAQNQNVRPIDRLSHAPSDSSPFPIFYPRQADNHQQGPYFNPHGFQHMPPPYIPPHCDIPAQPHYIPGIQYIHPQYGHGAYSPMMSPGQPIYPRIDMNGMRSCEFQDPAVGSHGVPGVPQSHNPIFNNASPVSNNSWIGQSPNECGSSKPSWPTLMESNKTPTKASLQQDSKIPVEDEEASRSITPSPTNARNRENTFGVTSSYSPINHVLSSPLQGTPELSSERMKAHNKSNQKIGLGLLGDGSSCSPGSSIRTPPISDHLFDSPVVSGSRFFPFARQNTSVTSTEQVLEHGIQRGAKRDSSHHSTYSGRSQPPIPKSLEEPDVPSDTLDSVLSFGEGVWGAEDLPMLKAKLHSNSTTSEESSALGSNPAARKRNFTAPAGTGRTFSLPEEPFALDESDLSYISPNSNQRTPDTTILLTPYQGMMSIHENTPPENGLGFGRFNWKRAEEWKEEAMKLALNEVRSELQRGFEAQSIGSGVQNELISTLESLRIGVERMMERSAEHETSNMSLILEDLPQNVLREGISVDSPPAFENIDPALRPTQNMPLFSDPETSLISEVGTGTSTSSAATFVSILLDGDSKLFHPDAIRRGTTGGKESAYALSTAVYQLCLENLPDGIIPNCFTVQVFLNESAIAARLKETGVIENEKLLSDFTAGFAGSHGLFTFVHVDTRQSAAAKIREHVRLFANVDACKMILVASNQTGEYRQLFQDFQRFGRSGLIHAARSTDLGETDPLDDVIDIHAIPGLYKIPVTQPSSDALGGRELQDSMLESARDPTLPLVPSSLPGDTKSSSQDKDSKKMNRVKKPELSSDISFGSVQNGSEAASEWKKISAELTKKRAKRTRNIASKVEESRPYANADYDQIDYHNVKKFHPRPCHRFYLTSGCKNGAKCHYGHDYELTDGEVNALRQLSKEMLCPAHAIGTCKGSAESCIYGHECPRNQQCSFGSDCWFTAVQGNHGKKSRT